MNFNTKTNQKGFTIVELLIVIVVIGILAAITIVAYNGIQKRANTSAAQSAANTIQKKAEAYNAVESAYPSTSAEFNAVKEAELVGGGIDLVTAVTADNGKGAIQFQHCGDTGARLRYFDYNAATPAASAWKLLGNATATMTTECTDVTYDAA